MSQDRWMPDIRPFRLNYCSKHRNSREYHSHRRCIRHNGRTPLVMNIISNLGGSAGRSIKVNIGIGIVTIRIDNPVARNGRIELVGRISRQLPFAAFKMNLLASGWSRTESNKDTEYQRRENRFLTHGNLQNGINFFTSWILTR